MTKKSFQCKKESDFVGNINKPRSASMRNVTLNKKNALRKSNLSNLAPIMKRIGSSIIDEQIEKGE